MGDQADLGRLTYLLPIKLHDPPDRELTSYLRSISRLCPVVVVDNSPPELFDAAHTAWGDFVTHVAPDPGFACVNGKVANVLSGLAHVPTDLLLIADDDVRYGAAELARMVTELDRADLVIPQNYFDPPSWHAMWDTARILLNRVSGGDFPGTLGVRTSYIRDGYDGDVLFENLELMRTVAARGGNCRRCDDFYVRRIGPPLRHFARQRVRYAYDEWARPRRMVAWLLVLPAMLALARRRPMAVPAAATLLIAAAEVGRRRHGGAAYFPAAASLFAPAWAAERAICIWLALLVRLRGGVKYNGRRVLRACNSMDGARRGIHAQTLSPSPTKLKRQ